jgi:hypothetical protein
MVSHRREYFCRTSLVTVRNQRDRVRFRQLILNAAARGTPIQLEIHTDERVSEVLVDAVTEQPCLYR